MTNFRNPEYTLVQFSRRVVRWLRRVATRILLVQIHEELADLRQRQDRLERQLHSLLGRHYDNIATSRRLAALEDLIREWQAANEIQEEPRPPQKG